MSITIEVGKQYVLANGFITSFQPVPDADHIKKGINKGWMFRGMVGDVDNPHKSYYFMEDGICPYFPEYNVMELAEVGEPVFSEETTVTKFIPGKYGFIEITEDNGISLCFRFLTPEDFSDCLEQIEYNKAIRLTSKVLNAIVDELETRNK